MQLKVLCDAAEIWYPQDTAEVEITGIFTDSREVTAGGLFICIRGLRADGHLYIDDAIENGAQCILVDRYAEIEARDGVIILRASNTRRTSAYLFDAWYGFPSRRLKLVGVTGTNGKTSVTHMLRAILEASLHRCGSIGTVGAVAVGKTYAGRASDPLANMTTPDPQVLYRLLTQMADDGVEYVVMEVSSHALALEKTAPLMFEAVIFTNLTPEHLDFHRTMENYAAAKARLMSQSRLAVINADSPYAEMMRKHAVGRCISCGVTNEDADYTALDVELLGREGVRYRLYSMRTSLKISCAIPGSFTVLNSMQAAITALELGCSPSVIKSVLSTMEGVKGRMERVRLGFDADFTVLIDYAHTPDALEKLLHTAKGFLGKSGRLTVLFGCGGDRDTIKRAVMGEIASRLSDNVILTSDNSRSEKPQKIIDEIRAGMQEGTPCKIIPDREAAIRYAIAQATAGEVILLAGKGHEEYEISSAGRRHFCEREIAIDAYKARRRIKKHEETE